MTTCHYCAQPLPTLGYHLSRAMLRKRKFCNRICATYHRQAKILARGPVNRRGNPLRERLTVPDSARRVATWDGVPAVCWHCGGLWKEILAGRSCLQCGRDVFVSSALATLGFESGATGFQPGN